MVSVASKRIIAKIPVVNFMYFATMPDSSAVNPEAVSSMLETIALVAALLATIAITGPMSVDYEELVAADER